MLIGRTYEFDLLENIRANKKANLVVCLGRRRIGKSTLIEEFLKEEEYSIKLQGLAPGTGMTNQDELNYVYNDFIKQTNYPHLKVDSWDSLFSLIAKYSEDKKITIFLDEISWMAHYDHKFPSILKAVWDREFSKNSKLLLILCGSVSSWIEENILSSTNFVGRISRDIILKEIPLEHCSEFWDKYRSKVLPVDKLKYLCVTGGVPRYLNETSKKADINKLLSTLCFSPSGFLYNEFDKIFLDVLGKKSSSYLKVVESIISGRKNFTEIAGALNIPTNGKLSQLLHHLELAGFIKAEKEWNLASGKDGKISHYRISDNYLRFYLKYIKPNKKKIEAKLFNCSEIEMLPQIQTILGLQFENLVLNNLHLVVNKLKIKKDTIINFGPYVQRKTNRSEPLQIDLLIQTKKQLYLCEIKFEEKISPKVLEEVEVKAQKLKYKKDKFQLIKVLIYAGELPKSIKDADVFDEYVNLLPFFK